MTERLDIPALLADVARVLVVGEPPHGDLAQLALDPRSAMRAQLQPRFGGALLSADALALLDDPDRLLLIHNLAAHLEPAGTLVVTDAADVEVLEPMLARCGFTVLEAGERLVARRTERTTVHDLVAAARSRLRRITADELEVALRSAQRPVVFDTRTPTDRDRVGVIPGAIHAPRTVLEWLADPASGYSHPAVESFDQLIVVVCNEGYSSSLAAASLLDLGFVNATDLVGGVMAWKAAGHAVERPDSHHVEPIVEW